MNAKTNEQTRVRDPLGTPRPIPSRYNLSIDVFRMFVPDSSGHIRKLGNEDGLNTNDDS